MGPGLSLQISGKLSELLGANYFCRGVRRSGKYVCGNRINDENVISEAVELLIEA